jgi:hypothetical protein
MPHNEKADASIYVTGVALGCVNAAEKRWEVVFIREPRHSLRMEIVKETNGQFEIIHPASIIPIGCRITIGATGNQSAPQTFTPNEQDCPENFNLVLDLEDDIYKAAVILKQPEVDLTPLFVVGPLLYSFAGRVTDFPVRLIVRGDQSQNPTAINRFGHISTTVGADINCGPDGGEVFVNVEGDGGYEFHLPHEEATTYLIKLDNSCPPDAPKISPPGAPTICDPDEKPTSDAIKEKSSDFVLYYLVVDPPVDQEEFDLVDDIDPSPDHRGDGLVCTYSHLGQTGSIST